MRFLIDECLHTSLVDIANACGYEAYHVAYLGLAGWTDRALMARVREGEYTFVTNNSVDFRRLYRREDLHAGLILFITQIEPDEQCTVFRWLLDEIGDREIVNTVIGIDIVGGELAMTEYPLP